VVQRLLCNQKNPDTTQASGFLLKVFGREQNVQSHHRQGLL